MIRVQRGGLVVTGRCFSQKKNPRIIPLEEIRTFLSKKNGNFVKFVKNLNFCIKI